MHARNEKPQTFKSCCYAKASPLYINANAYRFLVSKMTNPFLSLILFILLISIFNSFIIILVIGLV